MDAGASIAAFIGLVGLVAQSATSLIQLVKDIRDTPGTHLSNLKWLEQSSCVLKDLQNTGSTLQKANLAIDLSTLEEHLRDCRKAIDILRAHLEKSLNCLNSTGLGKRKAILKSYFGSKSADCQIQNIRRAIEGLSLCHNSITGQIVVQSLRSNQELTAQMNDLSLQTRDIRRAQESIAADTTINRQGLQQVQHASLETRQEVQNLAAAQEWMAAVQGVLPLEIGNLVGTAITEKQRSTSQDQQTLSNEAFRKQTLSLNAGFQNVSSLERPGMVPNSPKLDNTSDHQSLEKFQEMEKDFLLPYQNRNDDQTTFPSNMQGQRPYIKSKILMFSWYYRAFFGYISVVVSERHQVTAGREENVIHVEVKIFPWRWVSSRGFQARILYDRTHGLSSPTNIQLNFPRIIRCVSTDDVIWDFFHDRKSDLIIDNIRSGVYHPNDLVEITDDVFTELNLLWMGPMSLLTLASLFGDVKVVRFLLQQGARVDQTGSRLPQWDSVTRSDLQYALTPVSCWRNETKERPNIELINPPAARRAASREARLDTARLLINAGSDVDCITFPILLIWAIEWYLENILDVVGDDNNFHWDVIQLDIYSMDWYMALYSLWGLSDDLLAYQSRFERFVKLCKRLNIDLAFTQPSGLTSLHWMIEQSTGEHCLSVLITNGMDPCAVCEGYLTPTLVAFFQDKLDLWFTVLRQSGISVEAVAAHALRLVTGISLQEIFYRILIPEPKISSEYVFSTHCILDWWEGHQSDQASKFNDTKQLGAAFIEAFERQGCYLDEPGDRGNMVTYMASSSVDFKPSTVYDPERARRDFRRRTEGQKNPQ